MLWKTSFCLFAVRQSALFCLKSSQPRFLPYCSAFQVKRQIQQYAHSNSSPDRWSILTLPERTFATTMPKSSKQKKTSSSLNAAKKEHAAEAEGIMMILSPAKTLNLESLSSKGTAASNIPESSLWTLPHDVFRDQSRQVAQEMKKRSQTELGKLLSISANLAKVSHRVSFTRGYCYSDFLVWLRIFPLQFF